MVGARQSYGYLFSPLTDAESPASFLLKDQLWLQAVFAGLEEEKAKQEQEVVVVEGTSVGLGSCEKGEDGEKWKRRRRKRLERKK